MVRSEFKNRYLAFYLPRDSDKPRWQKIAEEAGISLSNFICEAVEAFIDTSRQPIQVESKELVDENAKLREELKNKTLRIAELENGISRRETAINTLETKINIMETEISGMRLLSANYFNVNDVSIKILAKNINEKDIQEALKGDETAYGQLMALQEAGIVVETKNGWRMVNKE